ncbi:MAG: NRDE family protein [Flavobacteriia bacterium]|nr:NRDE family protein [Flavobacteriia bacterium]
MCTLTYLPSDSGIIVTQNRDESPLRGAPVFPFRPSDNHLVYPKDPDGDGTWMLTDGEYVICVLNGAYEPHERHEPYRHSRGLLPKIALKQNPVGLTRADAEGLEPFSLFIFSKEEVTRFSWDAKELWVEHFDPKLPHIFQSAPLYSSPMQSTRTMWFQEWLQEHPMPTAQQILDFHFHGGDGANEMNICMYRPGVQTTAITQVEIANGKPASYFFHSILTDENTTVQL